MVGETRLLRLAGAAIAFVARQPLKVPKQVRYFVPITSSRMARNPVSDECR